VQGQKATETLLEVLDRKKEEQESNTYYRIILESQLIVNEK
jgi:hypothetical protein